jgi:hypothetical protein
LEGRRATDVWRRVVPRIAEFFQDGRELGEGVMQPG